MSAQLHDPVAPLPETLPEQKRKRLPAYERPLWTWRGFSYEVRKNWPLFLMAAPVVLLLLVFSYLPMVGLVIAFENYNDDPGIIGSPLVGFENFKYLFGTGEALTITTNTVFMNTLFIVTTLLGSLAIALLLNEVRDRSRFLPKFYQTALLFPYFLSYVIISYLVYTFLGDSGIANQTLKNLHMQPVDWYNSPQYWPLILTIVNFWKGAGYGSIIYLAGIIAINPEYFEASRIDGASKWQQIRHITLPLLKPLITVVILLGVAHILYADFGLFFQVTRDSAALYPTTDVINTFVYRSLIKLNDVSLPAAAGFYQSIVSCVMLLVVNGVVRRIDPERALF